MQISVNQRENIVVISLSGMFTATNSSEFRAEGNSILKVDNNKILLNLEALDFIFSVGIAEFISLGKRARQDGGDLRMCNLTTMVKDVLIATRVTSVFEAFGSLEEAINGF